MAVYTVLYTWSTEPHSSSSSCNRKQASIGSEAEEQHRYDGSLIARYAFSRSQPSATMSTIAVMHRTSQLHRGGCGLFSSWPWLNRYSTVSYRPHCAANINGVMNDGNSSESVVIVSFASYTLSPLFFSLNSNNLSKIWRLSCAIVNKIESPIRMPVRYNINNYNSMYNPL